MEIFFFVILLITLSIIGGISFGIAKFTQAILEQRGIKYAKHIAIAAFVLSVVLIFMWLNSSLSGTRWLGC